MNDSHERPTAVSGGRLPRWVPRKPADWGRLAASLVAWGIILATIGMVVGPAFHDIRTLGTHDWDQMESHRYLLYKSVHSYGQFPFWNPYGCGGHPSWAGIESGTTIVSPWLPFYLFAPLPIALKVEIVGTAVISAIGTWLLAGRFTRSAALRAFCCAVFVVNGRWALQIAAGHTWHLYYAWTPWVLYFFDRASRCGERSTSPGPAIRWRDVVLCGASIAMMVYTGAIYPLPQTVLVLGIWSILLAASYRTIRPVVAALASGVVGFGLSAPKLIPALDVVRRFPRLVESTETLDLHGFVVIFTSRDQNFGSRPAPLSPYGWHEWGIYIGWAAFLALIVGAVFARRGREGSLKAVGLILVLLGFGAFHEYAPWTLLHKLAPIFKSQHVPSRWLYPATLVLAVVFAAVLEQAMARLRSLRAMGEVVLLACAAWVSWDIAQVARLPFSQMFGAHMPTNPVKTAEFHTEARVGAEYEYDGISYGQATLPSEMANVGQIECMIFPGLSIFAKDAKGVIHGMGAKGRGDPAYRGEAYTASGKGRAELVHFTPNVMTVHVDGATPGDLLVLNQNWDPGWRADGVPAVAYQDAVATVVRGPNETVLFRYRPHYWWLSLGIFAITVGGIALAFERGRRARIERARWTGGAQVDGVDGVDGEPAAVERDAPAGPSEGPPISPTTS